MSKTIQAAGVASLIIGAAGCVAWFFVRQRSETQAIEDERLELADELDEIDEAFDTIGIPIEVDGHNLSTQERLNITVNVLGRRLQSMRQIFAQSVYVCENCSSASNEGGQCTRCRYLALALQTVEDGASDAGQTIMFTPNQSSMA